MGIKTPPVPPADESVQIPLILRGRQFSAADIEAILACTREHFAEGRTQISLAVCQSLAWYQPNGWPKERACRDVLLRLEQMGILELPPKKTVQPPSTGQVTLPHITSQRLSDYDLTTPITSLPDDVHIEIAKGNGAERLWNKLVDKHHYLGHKIIVGRCIKYLVKAGSNLLGALAFSSPAWRLSARDSFLRSIGIDQDDVPDLVINNCRFLILPHVEVINLASMALSMATRQVVKDWEEYYSLKPLVAETFVEQNKFKGTCYKAANWIAIGSTKGYEKKGRSHHNSQTPKIIYLYGLNRGIRGKIIRVYHDKIDCSS